MNIQDMTNEELIEDHRHYQSLHYHREKEVEAELLRRYDELENYKEDIEDACKMAMDEVCTADEKHCTCVPLLRLKISELERYFKQSNELLKNLNDENDELEKKVARLNLMLENSYKAVRDAGFCPPADNPAIVIGILKDQLAAANRAVRAMEKIMAARCTISAGIKIDAILTDYEAGK